jgi:3,4-dihydroxy 2-butanone 4-phosphate synthase/GTP cyclohydrolase II
LYENSIDEKDHLALIHGDISSVKDVLVRVHSECYTGDVLGSLRCDCGDQLKTSMQMIAEEGTGIILYLRQEGRGIGLHDKLRAYNLQDEGYDTVDANLALGHGADERDYTIGALMLQDLGVDSVRLITNNPEKIESLEAYGVDIVERIPLQPHLNEHNTEYLQTKMERMHHMLELRGAPVTSRHADRKVQDSLAVLQQAIAEHAASTEGPFVTLMFQQRLDGSVQPIVTSTKKADDQDPSVALAQRVTDAHGALLTSDDDSQIQRLDEGGEGDKAEIITLPSGRDVAEHLRITLDQLAKQGVRSVLIDGNTSTIDASINKKLADFIIIRMNLSFMSNKASVSVSGQSFKLTKTHTYQIEDSLYIQGIPKYDNCKGDS